MANKVPFFLTGANAKINVNGKTMAYCSDVSYRIEVAHAAPTLLGMYEPASLEPLSYKVSGSFSIIRYMRDVKDYMKSEGYSVPKGVSDSGNGIGSMSSTNPARRTIYGNDGKLHEAFDPSILSLAVRFEIEIYQKLPRQKKSGEDVLAPVARLRDCRIVVSDFALNKRSVAIQRFSFQAIYADEDSFYADFSGFGQQFA